MINIYHKTLLKKKYYLQIMVISLQYVRKNIFIKNVIIASRRERNAKG